MKRLIALTILMFLSLPVIAGDFMKGNALLGECDNGASAHCYIYIQGVIDAHETLSDWSDDKAKYICLEIGVTPSQLALITVKFMKDRPEKLHLTAASFVLLAVREAFPCTE